jgi:hypothetical protein
MKSSSRHPTHQMPSKKTKSVPNFHKIFNIDFIELKNNNYSIFKNFCSIVALNQCCKDLLFSICMLNPRFESRFLWFEVELTHFCLNWWKNQTMELVFCCVRNQNSNSEKTFLNIGSTFEGRKVDFLRKLISMLDLIIKK